MHFGAEIDPWLKACDMKLWQSERKNPVSCDPKSSMVNSCAETGSADHLGHCLELEQGVSLGHCLELGQGVNRLHLLLETKLTEGQHSTLGTKGS